MPYSRHDYFLIRSIALILFKSDWERFPTAIVDYKTSNESFLRLAYLYKQMGVANCEFILALYQPELQGIDPFDENLSAEIKLKIALECRYNPWYFFREVARIPPNAGTEPIPFKANRGNIAMYWSFFNHIDFGLLQPRQTGKSVSTDVLNTGIKDIWASNTTINLITKDLGLRNSNIERLKEIRNLLPEYIYFPNRLDADNSEMMTNLHLGNRYKTAVGRNDKIAADKLGRGLTVPIGHYDELAYINWIEVSLPVALSSGSAARDEAKAANQPYGNIYTTTAGNINSRDGKFAYQFMTGGAIWSEHFFDLPDQPTLERVVDKNSTGLKPLIYGAFNHRQLGKTDEWLYGKLRESASSGELADRDYFNIWTSGNEGSPLTQEEKAAVKESEIEVLHMKISDLGYAMRWYIPEAQIAARMASGNYVMGTDPSDALGEQNDATGLVIIDVRTHDVIAAGRFNETNLTYLGMFFADLLIKYPTITFIPERKSSGTALLDTMFIQLTKHGVDPFKRIFNRIVDEPETYETEYKEIKKSMSTRSTYFYDQYKRYFGFATTGAGRYSRDALYVDALKTMVKFGGHRMHDKTLVNELLSLTIRNGRIDHASGMHDDMVVSALLAHWFCTKAKNLSFYGIDATQVFTKAIVNKVALTDEEEYKQDMKSHYMNEFNGLLEELKTAKDPMIVSKIEMRLRQISGKFDFNDTMGIGIDAMIKQAQEERSRKSKVSRFRSRLNGLLTSDFRRAA